MGKEQALNSFPDGITLVDYDQALQELEIFSVMDADTVLTVAKLPDIVSSLAQAFQTIIFAQGESTQEEITTFGNPSRVIVTGYTFERKINNGGPKRIFARFAYSKNNPSLTIAVYSENERGPFRKPLPDYEIVWMEEADRPTYFANDYRDGKHNCYFPTSHPGITYQELKGFTQILKERVETFLSVLPELKMTKVPEVFSRAFKGSPRF